MDPSKRFVLIALIALLMLLVVNVVLAWLVPAVFAMVVEAGS